MNKKRGISPVIATVLLVGIVVVSSVIVFVWLRGFTQETVTKFGGENIELVCDDVQLEIEYSGGTLSVSNPGNVPIYGLNIRFVDESGGDFTTRKIRDITGNWPETGLDQGRAFSGNIGSETSGVNEILITPILMGNSQAGEQKSHECAEQHGYRITL